MRIMARKLFSRIRGLRRRTEGAAAVEFAIIGTVFILLIAGVMDLSHAWYMNNLMSNASREGARYGTRYWVTTDPNTGATMRTLPKDLQPTIQNYILNTSEANGGSGWGLSQLMPSDAGATVTLGGLGATETNPFSLAGEDLTVTIKAQKTWFLLGALVPGMGDHIELSVTTTMKCE